MRNIDYASKQLNKIRNRIEKAAISAGREVNSIRLIGAAKYQDPVVCEAFCQAGLTAIGENYLQHAIARQRVIERDAVEWHFIGRIQSNKTRAICGAFDWVHSVDRYKIAERFSRQNTTERPLHILLQLNVDDELSKAGVPFKDAAELCQQIAELEQIRLRGFMLIPKPRLGTDNQRKPFALARKTMEALNQSYGLQLDTLSMGMSNDLEAAVAEGATMLRIGSDLFGPRPPVSDDTQH